MADLIMAKKFIRLKQILPISILFVLLTFFLWKSQTYNIRNHYAIVDHLRHLERQDIILVNDTLKAQAQLTHSYDALTQHTEEFRQELSLLEGLLNTINPTENVHQRIQDLKDANEQRNHLIEDFKSDDAVLNNSLDYFPKASETFLATLDANNKPLYDRIIRLRTAVFQYQGITDHNALLKELTQDVIDLKNTNTPTALAQASSLDNLLTHGRLIFRVQPDVKAQIANLTNASTHRAIETLSNSYKTYYLRQSTLKNYYRFGLYLTSVALFVYSLGMYRNYRQTQALKDMNLQLEQQVTERTKDLKQTLKTLKQSQAQLIHAEKMSSLGQLAAGIAHEINNPVNFICGNLTIAQEYSEDLLTLAQLYKRHYRPIPEITEFERSIDLDFLAADYPKLLSSMEAGTYRVQEIVESMRTFSHLDEVGRKFANIHDGLESSLLILQHRLNPKGTQTKIVVERHYDAIPRILCCPGHLNQVFMNLLANAIDALESLDQFETMGYQPTITIRTQLHTDGASICITDNGPGIPDVVKSKLFEPFFTTKPVGEGTGLGLFISHQIVTGLHQGTLTCDSQPETGTKFCVRLPIVSSETAFTPSETAFTTLPNNQTSHFIGNGYIRGY